MRRAGASSSAFQLSSQDSLEQNLDVCAGLVQQASERGARLIVLPENFAYFSADLSRRDIAEALSGPPGPIREALGRWARTHGVTLIAGGFPERSNNPLRPYNTCAVVAPSGEVIASYRKLHLFDVDLSDGTQLRESEATLAGDPVNKSLGTVLYVSI